MTKAEKSQFNKLEFSNPQINKQNSLFYQYFLSLKPEEQEYETFFHFSKDQIYEIIKNYYLDLQTSLGKDAGKIIQHIMSYLYNKLDGQIDITNNFEGVEIGVKQDSFTLHISVKSSEEEKEQNVVKIKQTKVLDDEDKQRVAQPQKFASYIEQKELVLDVFNKVSKATSDLMGEDSVQMSAMIFVLYDIVCLSDYQHHNYELVIENNAISIEIQRDKIKFNLMSPSQAGPKNKLN